MATAAQQTATRQGLDWLQEPTLLKFWALSFFTDNQALEALMQGVGRGLRSGDTGVRLLRETAGLSKSSSKLPAEDPGVVVTGPQSQGENRRSEGKRRRVGGPIH